MDVATLVGIFTAFALVVSAIAMGGSMAIFVNVPSMLIVGGGTLGAAMINYPLPDILKVIKVVRNAFFHKRVTPGQIIANFVGLGRHRAEGRDPCTGSQHQ